MTAKSLAQVLVRVWGLVLVISAIELVAAMVIFLPADWRSAVFGTSIRVLIELGIGVTFLRNGDSIGAWLVSDIDESGPPVDAVRVQAIGFALLGVWFLIIGIAGLFAAGFTLLHHPGWDPPQLERLLEQKRTAFAIAATQTVAGAIILFRHADFAIRTSRVWRAIRGQETETSAE
jgi:hypothetical protein